MSEIDLPKQINSGDLVICLDTGSVGIVIEQQDRNTYMISFPYGTFPYDRDDFDVLKSGQN